MKLSNDQLAQRLESELGSGAINIDSGSIAAHKVDGREPAVLCLPQAPEQIAAILRICAEAEAAVTVWGGGTAIRTGNQPRRVDVIIASKGLHRLIEHDDANLTATVQAGIPISLLHERLAARKQFLAFDPPFPDRSTVGGVVAANLNGPRRMFYGSVRDLVIGLKAVLASGEQIKAGGKVVKNVAGYDVCKLFVGSLGTLGVISEVTLRLAPLPESAATLLVSGMLRQVLPLVGELRRSVLLPVAVVVLNSSADHRLDGGWTVAVLCEGFQESVERHLADIGTIAQRLRLNREIFRDNRHYQVWRQICDTPLQPSQSIFRLTVPPAAVSRSLEIIDGWRTEDSSGQIMSDAHAGTIWISLEPSAPPAGWLKQLLALASEQRGHVVLFAAPPSAKEGIDVWGHLPPSISIMREIKQQFDPKRLLNPGRFIGGI
jgi:glycolate oxidase FAD binding subunit